MKSSCIKAINHNLRRKTVIKIEFYFSRKNKHSFIADNKLQVDQIERKIERSSISHYLFENQILLKVKTTISFQVKN